MKQISTILLLLIASLCILPFAVSCQEFDSASWSSHLSSKPERPQWLISNDSIPTDETPKPKTDTIRIPVLCQDMLKSEDSDFYLTTGSVSIEYKAQERTLEWQTWNEGAKPDKNGWAPSINIVKSDWVVTSTRWLDPIEGCYQLIPIKQNESTEH